MDTAMRALANLNLSTSVKLYLSSELIFTNFAPRNTITLHLQGLLDRKRQTVHIARC